MRETEGRLWSRSEWKMETKLLTLCLPLGPQPGTLSTTRPELSESSACETRAQRWLLPSISVVVLDRPRKRLVWFQICTNMYIYALLSLTVKAIKYYLINLPDMWKNLSHTNHNNWFAITTILPQDWKAANILCVRNNCLDVWVRQWGIFNQTENRAMVRKQNIIIQLEFGQYSRQIIWIPKERSVRTLNYPMLEPWIYFWLKYNVHITFWISTSPIFLTTLLKSSEP